MVRKASPEDGEHASPGSPAKKGRGDAYIGNTAVLTIGQITSLLGTPPGQQAKTGSSSAQKNPIASCFLMFADLTYKNKNPAQNGADTRGPNCGEPRLGAHDKQFDPEARKRATLLKTFRYETAL
jgi:hypothetical protein